MFIQKFRSIDDVKDSLRDNLDELLLEAIHQDKKYLDINDYIKDRLSLKMKDLKGDEK